MSKKMGNTQEQPISLPKNIQQIGSTDSKIKVYLEDYSGTYLKRILVDDFLYHGILLGKKQVDHKQTFLFIQAVISVKVEEKEPYWKYDWNQIYEVMQKYFIEEGKEKPEILGWAMAVDEYKKLEESELEKMHKANFEGNMTLTFTMDLREGKEQFYILENNKFHSLDGYYIYYDKNKAMQEYVLENQPGPCVETEAVVKGNSESYRTILLRRKELMQKRHTISLLYVASTFLVMIVIVLGITMMNNYEKMQNMQDMIGELSKSVINEQAVHSNAEVSGQANHPTKLPQETKNTDVVEAMSKSVINSSDSSVLTDPSPSPTAKTVSGQSAIPVNSSLPNQNSQTDKSNDSSEKPTSTESSNARKRYEIQPGDTLAAISIKMYNTDKMVDEICEYNHIEDGDQIVAGDVLILP